MTVRFGRKLLQQVIATASLAAVLGLAAVDQQSIAQTKTNSRVGIKRAVFTAKSQPSASHIYLVEGQTFPFCRAIVTALRRMPPSTEISTWPGRLVVVIPGVKQPSWSALDALHYLPVLRAFLVARLRPGWHARPAEDDATWAEMEGDTKKQIASGKIRMEETIIRGVKLGIPSQVATVPEWVSDVHFVRIGLTDSSVGIIGLVDISTQKQQRPSIVSWGYVATSFSTFSAIHDVVVGDGRAGFEMVLVDSQPWFVGSSGVVSTPYTSDLGLSGPSVIHRIDLDEKCLVHFPTKLPDGTIR